MDNLELPPGFVFRHERTRKFFGVWHDAVGSLARSDNAPALSELTLPAAASVQPYFYARRDLRIVVQRGPPGTIVAVGLSVDHELEHLNHWLLLLLGGAGGIYVLALAGGYWLSGRALQPITEMSACAAAISAENLSQRIDVAATDAELAQLGTTLNDTFARLEQAFARQAAFTADASHELRTPLTIVLGHLELLLKKSAGREGHEELQACFRAAKRMKGLVEQLLLLARADAGKLATSAQSFDLFAVVEECVELLHPLADAKEIKLTVKGKGIEVHGDPQLLALVVTNLVTNAIQHHRVGGRVEVEVTDTPEAALLHVADNGPGIPVEAQSRLFERFFRVDESRSRDGGGNGLGLALARSVVRLHGGEVTFRSEVDCGTAFLVRLPRQVSEPQNA
jgi:heavy metal sensor kinase